jgi:hypothetical protein
MAARIAAANFEVNDDVRFVGTDTIYFVTKCNQTKREYQIQRGHDRANRQWVTEVYLELVERAGLGHAYRFGAQVARTYDRRLSSVNYR